MAKFCKYCGKPIPEGGACDCPQAVMSVSRQTMEQGQTAPGQMEQQAAISPANQQEKPNIPKANIQMDGALEKLKETGNLFLSFFTRPADTMQRALHTGDKIPQYLEAGLFAVVMFIMVGLIAKNDTVAFALEMADKSAFSIAAVLVIAFFAVRGIYAVAVYALSQKDNPAVHLPAVIGLFGMTFCLDTVMIILLMAASMISLAELQIAILLFWSVGTMLTAYLATWTILGGRTEKAYQMTMILHIILLIVLVFIARGMCVKIIEAGMGAMGRAFGSYGLW